MLFKTLVVSAFAALVAAQSAGNSTVLTFNTAPTSVVDGQATTLTWATNDTTSPVTILLRQGPSGNLQTVQTLTTSGTGGSFVWTPCTALPNGNNYALQILQNGQFNYFGPLTVSGYSASGTCSGLTVPSTSSSSSSSASITSTSSSSSSTGTGMITSTTGTRTSTSTSGSSTGTTTTSAATFQGTMKPTGNAAAPAFVYAGSSFAVALGGLAAMVIA